MKSLRSRRSKVSRSRRSKVIRSRRSKVRRSRRSKSKRSRRRRSRPSKLYKITDIDKLAYRLNKFPGLAEDIFKYLPAKELRLFLNAKEYEDLLNKFYDKMDDVGIINFNCKKRLKEAKKELRFVEKRLDVIHEYVNGGYKPKNYKKKYPFLKVIKESEL